jgi:nuclear migration protein JNM1
MNSKYQGLPDIVSIAVELDSRNRSCRFKDTAPDIFETADEPEPPLRPVGPLSLFSTARRRMLTMGQNDNGIAEDDAPPKPTSEAIDSSGLPARRKAERVFGRGTRRPGD